MRAVLLAVCIVSVGLIAGCSTAASAGGGVGPTSPGRDGRFSGPWADLFASTWAESTNDDERAALDDELISAEEYAFFQDAIVQCLEGLGAAARFNPDGTLDYTKPKSLTQEQVDACNVDNGIRILALHDAIVRNPDHLDESGIMLDCLRRTGVVGDAYTRSDLDNGVDLQVLGEDPDFAECAADPLGYEAD